MAEDENRIAHETLEDVNVRDRIERIKRIKRNVEEEIARKNTIVNLSEIEIVKCNAIIERKQTFIDAYNKKLDYLISSTGVGCSLQHFSFLIIFKNIIYCFWYCVFLLLIFVIK